MDDTWWVNESQLDTDQVSVIDGSIHSDHLITGGPGTGKTNLLVLKAKQMRKSGLVNIRLLVSTRSLREFLVSGGARYKLDQTQILTFDKFMYGLIIENGGVLPTSGTYRERRKYLAEECLRVTQHFKSPFNAILVDEGQDCFEEEVTLFRKLGEVCWVAADDKQNIYKVKGFETWRMSIAATLQSKLRYHYRNGRAICELADALSKRVGVDEQLVPSMRYDDRLSKSRVDEVESSTLDDQIDTLIEMLQAQLPAFPGELFGVITPRRETVDKIWEKIQSSPLATVSVCQNGQDDDEAFMKFEPTTRIFVCTTHSAKGLEARVIHIINCEKFVNMGKLRELAFTSVTRAKTRLFIHNSEPKPDFFQSALNASKKLVPQVKAEDLFN